MTNQIKIEFEFYFKDCDAGHGTVRVAAFEAIRMFVTGNTAVGNIGKVDIVDLVDWDTGDPGIHACAVLQGNEEDLRYLVFKNLQMDEGMDGFTNDAECNNAWNEMVEIL